MVEFWQEYMRRNRKEFILNRILHLCESKGFGMRFYELSQTLLDKLWEIIKCTKDDVIAGLIASIITLCQYKDQISINAICKFMNIRMSTIQSQVKRTIFERLRIPGFSTLIKSAGILEKILKKLGIFSAAKNESEGTYVLDAAEKRRAQIKAYQEINNDEDEEISQELQLQENHPQNHENFIIELTPNKSELEYSSYQFIICHKDTQNLIDLSLKIPKDKIGNKNYPDFEPTYFKINVLDLNSKGPPSMRI